MKKIISISIIIISLLMPMCSWAEPPVFSGGVNNEYEYEEIVFITGEPIKFVGKIDKKEKISDTEKSISYSFKLKPLDRSIQGSLDRSITLKTSYNKQLDRGQTIGETTIDKYKESIKFDKDRYELEDYQLSKSDVTDNTPASDFYSGNIIGRKYYTYNKDKGTVVVDISGSNTGYNNFWGKTETLTITKNIKSTTYTEDKDGDEDSNYWTGTVVIQSSDSTTKTLKYNENKAELTSISGGHMRLTNSNMVSSIKYNMPKVDDNEIYNSRRRTGTINLNKQMVPKIERLLIPKFRDVDGHWAQSYIKKLYSLDVFEENSMFFAPDIPISRKEFTRAIMRACNIRPANEENKPRRRGPVTPEKSPFKDLSITDKDYKYIKDAVDKGIISGVTKDLFKPEKSLTRAEAITIIIRAIGFQNRVPSPGYYISFVDDNEIPHWARDNVYVAKEIGLISGQSGKLNPQGILTRSEASALLVSVLDFLEKDLQKDYRENIINYN